jgi:Cd2+/Zn2+-exporting ATPase
MNSLAHYFKKIIRPSNRKTVLMIAAGTLIIVGWAAVWLADFPLVFNGLMITATLLAGIEIGQRAWQGLMNKQTNIDLLVSIAAIGGLAIGVYWESAAVTFLFLLGGWLEARTLSKTRSTLKELINLAPDTALLIENEEQREIPARQVEQGSLVLVKPGGKVPVDGTVETGKTTVDESAVTGEPFPAEKQKDSQVYAGTINQNGRIYVRADKAGGDTTLAKIIRRVEEAQEEKAPTQRFIERFARWYTPGIVVLSIASYAVTQNLELALTLLVIGCPGALVISTPISIITGIGRAAKKGMLIKGGEYLEDAGKITAIAMDKTGTLTEGKPRVTDLFSLLPAAVPAEEQPADESGTQEIFYQELSGNHENLSLDEPMRDLLYWTGIAESASEHPLAQAVLIESEKIGPIPKADDFQAHTGLGVEATYEANQIVVGSPDFIKRQNIAIPDKAESKIKELAKNGRTMVLTALNGHLIGGIGIADRIRPEAADMVRQLRENGIKEIVMLTGDSKETAHAIAKEAGITSVHARMLPEDKAAIIQKLQAQGHKVAMVGDGINDAPALATADIGIAMGAAGTDVAIETADIALMADELMKIPEALRLSKRTLINIRQNVVIALLTVTALLSGVFAGSVHMAGGMLIHELSVMIVIINGMRLRWA